jgi:hypothetical protein
MRRLKAVFPECHDDVGLFLYCDHILHKARAEKRHIAGGNKYVLICRLSKTGIEPAEAPTIRDKITHDRHAY